MHRAKIQFDENIGRVRAIGGLAQAVQTLTGTALDVSDLWRTQIVLSVSALDHFVHELARIGMTEIAKGLRATTDAFQRFQMPFSATTAALGGTPHEIWVGETVRERHSYRSFQDPDKLAEALRLISNAELWKEVATKLAMQMTDVKTKLKLVVDRRNKIAHEADLDPTCPGARWPISSAIAEDAVNFVEKLGFAIFQVVV